MKCIFIFLLLFMLIKPSFAQIYFNANINNNKNIGENGFKLITGNIYSGDFSDVRESDFKTANINLSEGKSFDFNIMYKINKNVRINFGFENQSNTNESYVLQNDKTESLYSYSTSDFIKKYILEQQITDLNFELKTQKIGLSYYYPLEKINFFGTVYLSYSKITFSRNFKDVTNTLSAKVVLYDSLGAIISVTDGEYRELKSEITTEKYLYKNSFNFNYELGLDYSITKYISLVFKARYNPNKYSIIYKETTTDYSTTVFKNTDITTTSYSDYTSGETKEQFFYPSLGISLGVSFVIPKPDDIKQFFKKKNKNTEDENIESVSDKEVQQKKINKNEPEK